MKNVRAFSLRLYAVWCELMFIVYAITGFVYVCVCVCVCAHAYKAQIQAFEALNQPRAY